MSRFVSKRSALWLCFAFFTGESLASEFYDRSAKGYALRRRYSEIAAEGVKLADKGLDRVWTRLAAEEKLLFLFSQLEEQRYAATDPEDRLGLSSVIWLLGAHLKQAAVKGQIEIKREHDAPHSVSGHQLLSKGGEVYAEAIELVDAAVRTDDKATP